MDDEPSLIRLVAGYLEHEEFLVTTAGDGELALNSARRDPPDVVVLDLMLLLPGSDGIEVCRRLRTFTEGRLAVTERRERGLCPGARRRRAEPRAAPRPAGRRRRR